MDLHEAKICWIIITASVVIRVRWENLKKKKKGPSEIRLSNPDTDVHLSSHPDQNHRAVHHYEEDLGPENLLDTVEYLQKKEPTLFTIYLQHDAVEPTSFIACL